MTPKPTILVPDSIPQRERGGGVRSIPLVNARIGSRRSLSGITEFDPGAAVALHFHNCEETVLVLSGSGLVEIAGKEISVGPLTTSWIPPGVHHRFRNVSPNEKLRIFWTYSSIDADRTIVATGLTTRIDEEQGVAPR